MKSPFLRRFGLPSPFFDNEAGFSPSVLLTGSTALLWLDPSDLTTMFQDAAGTTPVTAAGQPVGLVLDKSQGLVLGPELVTNGDFSVDANWTKGAGWTISGGVATTASSNSGTLDQAITLTAGRAYRVDYTITGWVSGQAQLGFSGGTTVLGPLSGTGNGTRSIVIFAVTGNNTLRVFKNTSLDAFSIDNISVRELPGFHASTPSASPNSRPTYGVVPSRGRVNLLTFSEAFDNAIWTKANGGVASAPVVTPNTATAPDGTLTADTIVFALNGGSTSTDISQLSQTVATLSGSSAWSIYLKTSDNSTKQLSLVSPSGVLSKITVTGSWQRFEVTGSGGSIARLRLRGDDGVSDSASLHVWGAQLELGSTATTYQRVVSQFDVTDPVGFPSYPLHYLSFDGVDDFLVTPTITPNADKVQVFAGVRKLSDAATAALAEFSTAGGNGRWLLSAPRSAGANYGFQSVGSLTSDPTASNFAAPITNVLTGLGDIGGDLVTLRVNGTQVAQSTADQGTGNYLAQQLFIGRRGGTSLPFNGQLYGLIARFSTANLDAAVISQTERWMGQKTGVTI